MDATLAERLKGRGWFIVLDGPDACGKSTQFARLNEYLDSRGVPHVSVREPGGTKVGEQIRNILLMDGDMSTMCDMLLFMAARAQLVESVIRPALADGVTVVCDRYISSTVAYQGLAGGLGLDVVWDVARHAVGGCLPDVTVLFDVSADVAERRMGPLNDRIESRGADYKDAVRRAYSYQARKQPDKFVVVNADGDADSVYAEMMDKLNKWMACHAL